MCGINLLGSFYQKIFIRLPETTCNHIDISCAVDRDDMGILSPALTNVAEVPDRHGRQWSLKAERQKTQRT
ncbi:hypothetical protein HAX54_029809 [Datura stramonium]|uniref:Uncharacterized protein n=1 Tax=Datura stramonium TaxID=4076 RepID=A0ABS8V8X1_DATST|nr:hypothetical protein [Datura stramonium]